MEKTLVTYVQSKHHDLRIQRDRFKFCVNVKN